MNIWRKIRDSICSLLIACLLVNAVTPLQVAYAISFNPEAEAAIFAPEAGEQNEVFDLVAIIVDTELDSDGRNYIGLQNDYPSLGADSMGARILRYAEDITSHNEMTDTKILFFDKEEDSVQDLAKALENLYINGSEGRSNRLAGVVLIGDIPLPVVNKAGNRFASVFPYTDFENKAYNYNPETNYFELDTFVSFPKPEIWHGILRSPEDSVAGMEKLASYFDKNHLYYQDEPEFADFQKRMFIGDLVAEQAKINSDVYDYYLNYLDNLENLAYQRFNKHWAQDITEEATGGFSDLAAASENSDVINPEGQEFLDSVGGDNALALVPDVQTKQIIEQFLIPYYQVFSNYISQLNDFAENTGRYEPVEVDNVPVLISMKDKYSQLYVKDVNTALEKKINEVLDQIQEPLPILVSSELSGFIDDAPFVVNDGALIPRTSLTYRFNYYNEKTNNNYINGVESDLLQYANQCSVYAGSTRSEYYNDELNYDPKSVDGEYSILTRNLSSDSIETAFPKHTIGLNTRLISPEDALEIAGVSEPGALIEDDLEKGIPAFSPNIIRANYVNPLNGKLQKGDLIVKINDKKIDYKWTVEQAIEKAYSDVQDVISKVNGDELEDIDEDILEKIYIISGENLGQGDIENAAANIGIEFYRDGQLERTNVTFTVNENALTGSSDPQGNPEIFIALSTIGLPRNPLTQNISIDFEEGTNGGIFSLFEIRPSGAHGGISNSGYDSYAGCSLSSSGRNSDRCFPFVALQPVKDMAGSVTLQKVNVPGEGEKLMFRERVDVSDTGQNTTESEPYANSLELFQFPGGGENDYYQFEDIDEVHYNSCYFGLPGTDLLSNDSNPYTDPLDKNSAPIGGFDPLEDEKEFDWYGRFLKGIGDFIASNQAYDIDDSPDKSEFLIDIDEFTAADVVLNNEGSGNFVVTLKTFSDRYGMFDGIDNDNDGIRDYEWRDIDEDGVYETKWYDFDEAQPVYGIPSWNTEEIARKMLSHQTKYVIPAGLPNNPFGVDLTLNVNPSQYKDVEVSSLIYHNEPSDETLATQILARTALSVPIDSPRYAAIQTAPLPGPEYPEPDPVDSNVDAQAIVSQLDIDSHYYPGETRKIVYPNLYRTDNLAQLQANLSSLATEIALMPGSYRIFGENATADQYSAIQIRDEILENYFSPVVNGAFDNPTNGYDLEIADEEKVADALEWLNLDIDGKHEYVLKKYLNGEENAFVGDQTLLPAPQGYDVETGYEAAYLVLEGERDYFDFGFNKDQNEETDSRFNPLSEDYIEPGAPDYNQIQNQLAAEQSGNSGGQNNEDDEDESYQFVDLEQFLKEVEEFINYFTTEPEFYDSCGFTEAFDQDGDIPVPDGQSNSAGTSSSGSELTIAEPRALNLSVNRTAVAANDLEDLIVTVRVLDQNGQQMGHQAGNIRINLTVRQDEENPVLRTSDRLEKVPVNGEVQFKLQAAGGGGQVTLSANSENLISNSVNVFGLETDLRMFSFVTFEPEFNEDIELEIARLVDDQETIDALTNQDEDSTSIEDLLGGEMTILEAESDEGSDDDSDINGGSGSSGDGSSGQVSGGIDVDEDDFSISEDLGETIEEIQNGTNNNNSAQNDGLGGNQTVDSENVTSTDSGQNTDSNENQSGSENADSSGNEETIDENGNIVILESELVEDEDNENVEEDTGETVDSEVENETEDNEEVELENEADVDAETDSINENLIDTWQDYFLQNRYYEQYFIPESRRSNTESSTVNWQAQAFSDQMTSGRMIAALPDSQNPFIDAVENPESTYLLESSDQFVANGESLMMVQAQILDENGDLVTANGLTVRFSVSSSDYPDMVVFENGDLTSVEDGIASVYLRAGTKAGRLTLKAEVLGGGYPVREKEIYLSPGEPVSIEINPETNTLVANGESKSNVTFILRDEFGNIANNTFAQLALFITGDAKFANNADINAPLPGLQIGTFEGGANVEIVAGENAGNVNLLALLVNYELEEALLDFGTQNIDFSQYIGNSESFEILDEVELDLSTVGSGDLVGIRSELLRAGERVEDYSGPIKFKIINENLGSFVNNFGQEVTELERSMDGGLLHEANVKFKSNNIAGFADILVEVPGFVTESVTVKIEPEPPVVIDLTASEEVIFADSSEEVILEAKLLDQYGNLVESSNSNFVTFEITDSTSEFARFTSDATVLVENGVASIPIVGGQKSGNVNIIAKSGNLIEDTLSIEVKKRFDASDMEDLAPRALYVSILGGAYGEVETSNNLAQNILFNGESQAVTATTAKANDFMKLVSIEGNGRVQVLNENISTEVIPANEAFPYQKVIFSDIVENQELGEMFMVPKVNADASLISTDSEISEEGIYIRRISESSPEFVFEENNGTVTIEKNGLNAVEIDNFGRIRMNDESLILRLLDEEDGILSRNLAYVIEDRGQILALIEFNQNFSAELLDLNNSQSAFTAGVYLKPRTFNQKYAFDEAFSGASTAEGKGFYIVDLENEIDGSMSPGFSYTSLERAGDTSGVGFQGNNKHMLLFSAGNSVGESNIPYASEVGINYGDPTIKLQVEGIVGLVSGLSGFTKDIGVPIFTGEEQIQEMIEFDYNGDGNDDLLLLYESGLARLLENENSNKKFRDKGYILNITNGILAATKIDVNNDGFDDLVVSNVESCGPDGECITLLTNIGGGFTNSLLDLEVSGDVYELEARDMNLDNCEDLVLSDSAGTIRLFLNEENSGNCLGLEEDDSLNRSFGFSIDGGFDLGDSLFVNYPGMEQPDNENYSNIGNYIQLVLLSDEPPEGANAGFAEDAQDFQALIESGGAIASAIAPPQTYPTEFDFINIKADSRLIDSEKNVIDANGETVAVGDKLNYVITLENNSSAAISNMMISDLTSPVMTLLEDSLECLDNNCPDELEWLDSEQSLRGKVITGVSVPANGTRTIKYSFQVEEMTTVDFDLGNDFVDYPANNDDGYPDILVKPEVNPEGELHYLYSNVNQNSGRVTYALHTTTPSTQDPQEVASDYYEQNDIYNPYQYDTSNPQNDPDAVAAVQTLQNEQEQDSDYNGKPDAWDEFAQGYHDVTDAIANSIQETTSLLRCSGGGCLPIPYNKALFVPDTENPVGFPLFGIYPPPTFFRPMPLASTVDESTFRFYTSPTLTGGVGTAACVGPGPGLQSPCYAQALPMQAMGACDLIPGLNELNSAIANSGDSNVDPDIGRSTIASNGDPVAGSDAINEGFSFSDPDFPFSAAGSVNIKIPGFPSVITDWLDNQTDEIYNKLLDLPDFYFIYPDVSSLVSEHAVAAGNFSRIRSANDFLKAVNSMPLVQIEGKEVLIKVPAISEAEIVKWQRQAHFWLLHMEEQIRKIEEFWTCDVNPDRKTICDAVLVNMNDLVNSVRETMDELDQIKNLPREILTWRDIEAKYATQIVCYLDATMNYTGGYINRQTQIIEAWFQAIEEAIRIFRDWKLLLDLILEYQVSCDQCMSDRFSKLGLLLQLFAVIPEPPVIPIPKWPDIVFDVSQLKAGVKIVWPDLVFQPEPIILPDLPVVTLPEFMPSVAIDVPGWDFPWDFPEFLLPELPDLPPLPLPKLPDLPRPPKLLPFPDIIAELIANLRPIFTILCLLKKGLLPVPEWALGIEIETLTQPTVHIIVPLIKYLGLQWPAIEYDYVEQIKVTAKLDMGISTDFIYLFVEGKADEWNEALEGWIEDINEFTQFPIQEFINQWEDRAAEALNDAIEDGLEETGIVEDESNEVSYGEDYENDYLAAATEGPTVTIGGQKMESDEVYDFLNEYDPQFNELEFRFNEINNVITEYVETMEEYEYPDTVHLAATQEYLDPSDPLLNRTIAEVERDILEQELPNTEEMQHLAELRDELIAYTKNLNSGNDVLGEIEDYGDAATFIVENDQSLDRIVALSSANLNDGITEEVSQSSFFGEEVEEYINEAAFGEISENDLIAATDISYDSFDTNVEEAGNAAQNRVPSGFYIAVGGMNENILYYDDEISDNFHSIFSDIDGDDDHDILYVVGGDVYLKEDRTNDAPEKDRGTLIISPFNNAVSDYVEDGSSSVQGVRASYEGYREFDLNWNAIDGALGYEVVLKERIFDDEDEAERRYLVVEDLESEFARNRFEELPGDYEMLEMSNADLPAISVEIDNGNYYPTIYAINADGERSQPSYNQVVSPQICADEDAPFPVISSVEFELPLFRSLNVDAGDSFDPTGVVTDFYLEVLPYEGEDDLEITTASELILTQGNANASALNRLPSGVAINSGDEIEGELFEINEQFVIGPFENEGDIGEHRFRVIVVDQVGNAATQEISVNVITPQITLDQTFSRTGIASGEVDPAFDNVPFALMRERLVHRVIDGELKLVPRIEKVVTDSIGQFEKYYTSGNGRYEISDFELEDMILIEDSNGEIVGEINPQTGNIGNLSNGISVIVEEAVPPNEATKFVIVDENGTVLATVYAVGDGNEDVQVYEEVELEEVENLQFKGVSVNDFDLSDGFEFYRFPASDPNYAGGVGLNYLADEKHVLVVDSGGNVLILDERISLEQKENSHENDPLIINVFFENEKIAEIYIAALSSIRNIVFIGPNDVPYATPKTPSPASFYGTNENLRFLDVEDEELRELLNDLFTKGIIEGFETDQGLVFNPQELVSRAEFTKSLLLMLCIVPRDAAYLPYSSNEVNGGFSDIEYSENDLSWFYPYVKEAALLGLVEGYTGEFDASGRNPFKPENTITRAEGAKIILEALEFKGIIDLSNLSESEPWFAAYVNASLDLTPYVVGDEVLKNNFLLTPEEAADPTREMTREELILLAYRVLEASNCYEIDEDGDEMSDFCELRYGIDLPNEDEDGDGLLNTDECFYGYDPTEQDSDGGGTNDGDEVAQGTNPLNPYDDAFDADGDGLTDAAEIFVYNTDPNDADTDDGGINDGDEVNQLLDPLNGSDDLDDAGEISEGENGLYIVPADCNTCPCNSTLLHRADLIPGDIFFSAISNFEETFVFSKSNEVKIESVTNEND